MRPRQTLLLGLLLLVPVLAFLFLYRFGANRYALPTYLPDRVDSTQVGGKWQRDTVFHQIQPFQLLASNGRELTSQSLGRGMWVAQLFGPDETSARVARELLQVQEKFRQEPLVRIVSIVLEPGPSPAATLAQLAEQYGTIAGKWTFATGAADALKQVAQQELGRAAQPHQLPPMVGPNLPPGTLLLIDRDRRVRGVYDGTKPREIDRLLTEINVQLYEYAHSH
ncbi:SCO family protein [Hymenobacter sp. PAMC 26628]|uniref:SCO family protein n=1 Tax=Hymenobacter sp. PAMC 26628 TaxID=1484118 RepID=UPI00076FE185|nr:hypothetical protein [Hymenobacter sp. PAMC 26628]AMJ66739.1 hypothetical protein AXW84_15860 [Hymenobacter sp. PAMC 26628]